MKPILVFVALFTAVLAAADKPTLAIAPVTVNTALQQSPRNSDLAVAILRVKESLQTQLINAFGQVGKFTVVSRTDLPPVVQEQILGQSGNISAATAPKQGAIEGASYVLVVGIDDFQLLIERAQFQSISRQQQHAILSVLAVARIYDANTGALIASTSGRVSGKDFQQYFTFAEREGDLESAIYTQTAITLANELAAKLANQLYPARVIARTGDQITINRGSAHGFANTGDMLMIYALGSRLVDPDTGEYLGMEEVFIGSASVFRVDDRITMAIVNEDNGVQVGQVVRKAQ